MPRQDRVPIPVARLATAVAGGVLVASAMPPWGFWPLAFVGIGLFEFAIGDDLGRWWRARLGFVFALPWMLLGMGWMWFLTPPGYVVTSVLFALFHGAAAAAAPAGTWRIVGRPAAHTLAEIIRMVVPFGGVPLATLGISQAGGPLLGIARVGGVILLTWVVFQVGVSLAELGEVRVARSPQALGAAAAVALIVVLAAIAPEGADRSVPALTIAAVQGGGEQGTTALDVPSSRVTQAHLDATATIGPSPELDLVVWPENGIDVNGIAFEDSQALADVAAQAARLGVPFAIGVTLDSEFSAHPSEGSFVNSQFVVTPDGRVTSGYEKVRIVPFGEYVPLRGLLEALGAPLDEIPSDAVRGTRPCRDRAPRRHAPRRDDLVGGLLR